LISALRRRRAYVPAVAILGFYLAWRVLLAGGVWDDSAAAYDFEHSFWPAARDVLHGNSPFPPATRQALETGTAFVYPAPAALFLAPFGLLSVHAAAALFTAVLFASALLALWLAGVRDRRCYLAAFLWWPVQSAIMTANISLLLALAAAVLWRYRDRRVVAGLAAGAAVALKPFVWPLFIWLLATRRYAAAAWGLGAGLVLTFGSWAILGFAGLGDYVPSLRILARIEERASYTPLGAALQLGAGLGVARTLGVVAGLAALAWLVLLAWRQHDERRAFAVALAACLLCSPIVWLHYYALALVAVAVLKPRFSALWLLPILAAGPARPSAPSWWAVLVLAVMAATLASALAEGSWRLELLGPVRRRAAARF
jgi:hypothetical protein